MMLFTKITPVEGLILSRIRAIWMIVLTILGSIGRRGDQGPELSMIKVDFLFNLCLIISGLIKPSGKFFLSLNG